MLNSHTARGLLALLLIGISPLASGQGVVLTLDCHGKADSKKGMYTDALSALSAVERAAATAAGQWTTLRVMPGVYWLDAPGDTAVRRPLPRDEGIPFAARLKANKVRIVGQGASPAEVVWAVNRGQTQGAEGNYTMLRYEGRDLVVENMTLGNYCNVPLEYAPDSTQNRPARSPATTQAQIALCYEADRVHLHNCHFVGRLNACPFCGSRRTLFTGCRIACGDDALPAGAVFVDCQIDLHSSKPWYTTGPVGAFLLGCALRSETVGTQYFSKRGGPVTLFGCQLMGYKVTGWQTSAGADACVSYVRNTDVVSGRPGVGLSAARGRLVLADSAVYVLPGGGWNVRGLVEGSDGWNPTRQAGGERRPTTLLLEPEKQRVGADRGTMTVFFVGLYADGQEAFRGSQEVDATNHDWRRKLKSVQCEQEGLHGLCKIIVEGRLHSAPGFERQPTIQQRGPALWLDYSLTPDDSLDIEGQADVSRVTWWRRTAAGDTVAICEGEQLARNVMCTSAEAGCSVLCRVVPQRLGSRPGEAVWCSPVAVSAGQEGRLGLGTDFQSVPVRHHARPYPDVWLMDAWRPAELAKWGWAPESSPARPAWQRTEEGLKLVGRGGRLRYVPEGVHSDTCELALRLDPLKTGGQGFGSATGQWLDCVVRYDTLTNSGVGLRLERRPESANAVLMTPILYDRGVGHQVGPQKWTQLFRPGCVVVVRAIGQQLTCLVEQPSEGKRAGVDCVVPYSDAVGVLVNHTGSLGEGGMTLRAAHVAWGGVGVVVREALMEREP